MFSKNNVLENITWFSVEQLADLIKNGVVTYDEVIEAAGPSFTPDKVEQLTALIGDEEEDMYIDLLANRSVSACKDYLAKYPNGTYRAAVVSLMRNLIKKENRQKVNSSEQNQPKQENTSQQENNLIKQVRSLGTIEGYQKYLRLYPTGKYAQEARNMIEILGSKVDAEKTELLENAEQESAGLSEWAAVNKADIDALSEYLSSHPDSAYAPEADTIINDLFRQLPDPSLFLNMKLNQIQTKKITAEMKNNQILNLIRRMIWSGAMPSANFLNIISEDHNLLNAGVIRQLVEEGTITVNDLQEIGIDRQFIQKMLRKDALTTFPNPGRLDRVKYQSTEVYFWGIPSSGKSCALGAILSTAASGTVSKSMMAYSDSQGYGYLTRLIDLFKDGAVCNLMTGTDITAFYEMGFELVDDNDAIHPITCIDMAGELMRCMYKHNAGDPMTDQEKDMLSTMTRVLVDNRTSSRKMHIFVVEYGAEERLYDGLPQRTYLEGACAYIRKTGLFSTDTDSIYLMITKADKLKDPSVEAFNNYVNENYRSFCNGLEHICKENEINGGRIEKLAFSLGEVCFQNYCRFNARPAENVVNLLLNHSASFHTGRRGWWERIFRS